MAKDTKTTQKEKILVTGDFSFDWLEMQVPVSISKSTKDSDFLNWQTYPRINRHVKLGGAPLLSEFIDQASKGDVQSPQMDGRGDLSSENCIHSYASVQRFPQSVFGKPSKDEVIRIKEFKGFSGPEKGTPFFVSPKPGDSDADFVVLYDEGNGFRETKHAWPKALTGRKKPWVILSMRQPIGKGSLWENIQKRHLDRTVLIIDADDLRAQGAKISRRLSWERTAKDTIWQLASNPELLDLNGLACLIIRFGMEGAVLHTRQGGEVSSRLFFDPVIGEDGFGKVYPGTMSGVKAAFVAALTTAMANKELSGLEEGVRYGLLSSRKLWQLGFGQEPDTLDYPSAEIFKISAEEKAAIADVVIPNPTATEPADPDYWCILDDLCFSGLEDVAYNFVRFGKDSALDQIPIGEFRFLKTYDRSEIESFRGIKNLIGEYLESPSTSRPLSIAVFGTPGSGKSFGVTEVAESVAPGKLAKLEFNLSQFNSVEDLVEAFHKVRDVALGGKIPIVFFDEFDSEFGGKLGWLKYFLAPMQDGQFRDGEAIHPVGRAIFVFAGGTCCTFSEFAREKGDEEFKGAKGPDFVSRLRGYVNIKGPNPVSEEDRLFVVRRAIFLRFLLQKKAKNIFDARKMCRIDPGVLRAMIKVPAYKHGVRSMEAIIDMSLLSGRKSFEQAALPSPEQLKLHVDAEMFPRLVVRDVLLGSAREILAQAIHEKYREDNIGKRPDDDPAMATWDNLLEDLRESNRQQADHIPVKLKAVGRDFIPVVGREPKLARFTKTEVEIMSEKEHDRFVTGRFIQGWSMGKRDAKKKTSPYLGGWNDLPEDIKEYDREAVRAIPKLLAKAGFEIYRLRNK